MTYLFLSSHKQWRRILLTLSVHHHYPQNSNGRDFFIGDIHGKYALLTRALINLDFDFKADRLFSVGDLIDRGEASFSCLLLARKEWFMPVLGNHEQFLLNTAGGDGYNKLIWYQNGGGWWEELTVRGRALIVEIIKHNYALTLSVDTLAGRIGVVHAKYPLYQWPMREADVDDEVLTELVWDRDIISSKKQPHAIAGIDFIVSGHTPLEQPLFKNRQLFIDTGCGHQPNIFNPEPRLTICQFKRGAIKLYAQAEQDFSSSAVFQVYFKLLQIGF
jgi:hypothetical protein